MAVALLFLGGCSMHNRAGVVAGGAAPLAEDLRWQLGTVALAPDTKPAQFSYDQATGQTADAADWAGTAAGEMLGTSTGEPILDLPAGVGNVLLAPVAAIKGAWEARERLSPEKLSDCEANLIKAMREMSLQKRFHDRLLEAASEQCPGRLVPLDQLQAAGSHGHSADSVLEARVEELRLKRTGSSDSSYRLWIKTRMRLVRTADGVVLYDQSAEYQSGKCLFVDWTLDNALHNVADTGYRQLAEQCASRLLTTTDMPRLAGAGHRKTPAPNRDMTFQLASHRAPASHLPTRLVSYPMTDPGTLGIYSTGTVAHVVFQRPPTRDEATSEALSDVDYLFDGLNRHPNMLVALPVCAVAVPISLWKQIAALVRGLSPQTVQEADEKLSRAANETRPHQVLAFLVAQQLAPQTSLPVIVVRQPLPPGAEEDAELMQYMAHGTLASLTGGQTASGYLLSQGAGTALEIHVESAVLAGNGGINPKLALSVEARATLLRSRDSQQLYSCPVHYRSQGRQFTAWAAHDAKLFREELQKCYHELSAALVDQLVARGVVPPSSKSQPLFANHQ
jgi:hypothetical protein